MTPRPRSTEKRICRLLLIIVVSSFLRGGFVSPIPARAENLGPGGGTRILAGDQVIGPYRIYATVSPEPAYAGTLTFVVRLSDPTTNHKVLDADITVTLTDQADPAMVISGAATHANAGNPVDYAAHIPIDRPATYAGLIAVRGEAGVAEIPFIETVSPPRRLSGLLIAGLPFLVILAVLGGLWFARSGKP
jgi:hypothetical protein